MALNVATRADLEAWTHWLDELGIAHSGIRAGDVPFAFATVVFRDPDNIQLELFAQAVDAIESRYRERELTPLVMLPRPPGAATTDDPLGTLLLQRGWVEGNPADVLTGRTETLLHRAGPSPAGFALAVRDAPDEDWLAGGSPRIHDHLDAARQILALPAHQLFLTARGEGGAVAGIVRVALNDGWAGLFGLHVDPMHRGRGLGRWLTIEALRAAAAAGASLAYLQVEPGNEPAQRLYRGLGMTAHHDYVYLAHRQDSARP